MAGHEDVTHTEVDLNSQTHIVHPKLFTTAAIARPTTSPMDVGSSPWRQDGILSLSWGTSYAAPLVAGVAANGWASLERAGQAVTPELVRALVIHSAALSSPGRRPEDLRYFGFGIPGSL